MPCDPGANTLNPLALGPPPAVPGFGLPFGPIQIPFPDVQLPDGIPEDLLQLIEDFLTNFPGGPFRPNFDNFAKDVLDALASLFNQLAPYLGLYRFLQALLNIILCIIDILCAATNPFSMLRALRRLFKRCLPDFLNLFPWLALIAMIIALLLLLLALIQYLIEQIIALIQDIIENLLLLSEAVLFDDSERQLAAARKIAQVLCIIEQLFAILIAFQAILAIISALADLGGRTVCGKQGSTGGDDFECCPDDVCPPFIFNNPDGLTGTLGQLVYYREIDNNVSLLPVGIELPPIRNESWQFFDAETQTYNFSDIITKIDDNIFWPEGQTYDADATVKRIPYILDMRLTVDPATFNLPDPVGGSREFFIKDVVVIRKPTLTVTDYDGTTTPETNGVLRLEGGLVYESDETTPFDVGGSQATLNDFIHLTSGIGLPSSDDGYVISNISYTLRINHPVLIQEALITMGCDPDLQIETTALNSTLEITSVLSRIGELPDVAGTVDCLNDTIASIRSDVSPTNVATQSANLQTCLNDLREQTLTTYENAVTAGTNVYSSTIELDTDVQFINNPINVKVTLKDAGGTTLSFRVPNDVENSLSSKIVGDPSLGTITNFAFDGYESFVAELTSPTPGDGYLGVSFDNQVFSSIINRDNDDLPTTIIENKVPYTFVGTPVSAVSDENGLERRDEVDIGIDGSS